MRFRLGFDRVLRAHPDLLTDLSQRLPLVPTDEALETLAAEYGWHNSFFRPPALPLAKAPASGDVGRLLLGNVAAAPKNPGMHSAKAPAANAAAHVSIVNRPAIAALAPIRPPPPTQLLHPPVPKSAQRPPAKQAPAILQPFLHPAKAASRSEPLRTLPRLQTWTRLWQLCL